MQQKQNYEDLFPKDLDFYGIGKVQAESSEKFRHTELQAESVVITRLIDADFLGLSGASQQASASAGTCLFQFSTKPQNESMALEMTNILASQLAAQISKKIGSKVIVTPSEVARVQYSENALSGARVYSFQSEYESFMIRMLFISPSSGLA